MSKAMKKVLALLGALVLVLVGAIMGVTRLTPDTAKAVEPVAAEETRETTETASAEEDVAPETETNAQPAVMVIETATSTMCVNSQTGEIIWEREKVTETAEKTEVEAVEEPEEEEVAEEVVETVETVEAAEEAPEVVETEQKSAPTVVETEWAIICYDSTTGEILWEREKKSETKEPSETVEAEEAPDEVVETVEIVDNVDLPDTPETPETLELASSEEVSEVADVAESTEVIEEVTEEEAIAPGKTYVVEGEVNVYATRTSTSSFTTISAGTSVLVVAVDGQFTTIHVPYGETVVEVYVLTADLLGNG